MTRTGSSAPLRYYGLPSYSIKNNMGKQCICATVGGVFIMKLPFHARTDMGFMQAYSIGH